LSLDIQLVSTAGNFFEQIHKVVAQFIDWIHLCLQAHS